MSLHSCDTVCPSLTSMYWTHNKPQGEEVNTASAVIWLICIPFGLSYIANSKILVWNVALIKLHFGTGFFFVVVFLQLSLCVYSLCIIKYQLICWITTDTSSVMRYKLCPLEGTILHSFKPFSFDILTIAGLNLYEAFMKMFSLLKQPERISFFCFVDLINFFQRQ